MRIWKIQHLIPKYDQVGNIVETQAIIHVVDGLYGQLIVDVPGDITKEDPETLPKKILKLFHKEQYSDYEVSEAVLEVEKLKQVIVDAQKSITDIKTDYENVKSTIERDENSRRITVETLSSQLEDLRNKDAELEALIMEFMMTGGGTLG